MTKEWSSRISKVLDMTIEKMKDFLHMYAIIAHVRS